VNDSDVLTRAAKALREAHTGERQGSGFTRARIMNSLHRERRSRILRWAILSPIASVLLVGSAWAQSTGKWPVLWKAVASVFVAAPATESAPPVPPPKRSSRPSEPTELDVPVPDAPLDAVPEALPPQPAPPLIEPLPTEPVVREARRPRSKRRASAPPASISARPAAPISEDPESAPEPARDRELSRFRRAHDLHFAGDRPREAIRAYAEYLREFPDGRFVPEARYNSALDQIKLGDDEAAREALAPFAAGAFGGYRQKEARELLDALRRKPSTSR
jgi:hypothetical protein